MAMMVKPRPPYVPPPKVKKKGTRLKAIGANRKMLNALCGPSRKEFVAEVGVCMVCRQAQAIDCHEIIRGPGREAALAQPQLWLAVCRPCHEAMDDASEWPVPRQLMARVGWELEATIRLANACAGLAETAITEQEVLSYGDWHALA